MRLFSKAEERIVSVQNASLSNIVPIVYGAVISYSMYVLSKLLSDLFSNRSELISLPIESAVKFTNNINSIAIFLCIWLFLIQEIGSIYKLGNIFKYKRTSRYTHEMWIATFYVTAFTFLEISSYVTVLIFSLVLILGGLWCNQLKEEYPNHKTKIHLLMKLECQIYYSGGLIFLIQFIFFYGFYHELKFHVFSTFIFLITFMFFLIILAIIPYLKHGSNVLGYSVNIILPDFLFGKFTKVRIPNQQPRIKRKKINGIHHE